MIGAQQPQYGGLTGMMDEQAKQRQGQMVMPQAQQPQAAQTQTVPQVGQPQQAQMPNPMSSHGPPTGAPPGTTPNVPPPGDKSGGAHGDRPGGTPPPAPPGTPGAATPDISQGSGLHAQGVGTGFINLQNILNANSGQGDDMAKKIATQKSYTQDAGDYMNNLNTLPGISADLQSVYGKSSPYTPQMSMLDALIAKNGAQRYGGFGALEQQMNAIPSAPPPPRGRGGGSGSGGSGNLAAPGGSGNPGRRGKHQEQ